MSTTDERMFYLMLSATEGQEFAHAMGYQSPSEDVQKLEIMDVISRIFVFQTCGILEEIKESSELFLSLLERMDKLNSPSEEFKQVLMAFSISLINKLLDKDVLALLLETEDLEKFEETLDKLKELDSDE